MFFGNQIPVVILDIKGVAQKWTLGAYTTEFVQVGSKFWVRNTFFKCWILLLVEPVKGLVYTSKGGVFAKSAKLEQNF